MLPSQLAVDVPISSLIAGLLLISMCARIHLAPQLVTTVHDFSMIPCLLAFALVVALQPSGWLASGGCLPAVGYYLVQSLQPWKECWTNLDVLVRVGFSYYHTLTVIRLMWGINGRYYYYYEKDILAKYFHYNTMLLLESNDIRLSHFIVIPYEKAEWMNELEKTEMLPSCSYRFCTKLIAISSSTSTVNITLNTVSWALAMWVISLSWCMCMSIIQIIQ